MFLRTSTPITHREGSENTAGTENTVPGTKTYRGTETPCREKNIQNTIQGTKLPGIDIHHSAEYERFFSVHVHPSAH